MGPFPPTDRRFECEFAGIFRIAEDRIAELRLTWDNLGTLMQLGHVRPTESGLTAAADRPGAGARNTGDAVIGRSGRAQHRGVVQSARRTVPRALDPSLR